MKVSAILKGKKDEHGRLTIYIRTNQGEKRTFKATKMRVTPEQFKEGRVVGHPQAKLYNQTIQKVIIETEAGHIRGDRAYPDAMLSAYLLKLLRQWDREKKPATLKQFETEINKFIEWHGDTKLSKITTDVLNEYKAYLNKTYGASNTVWKGFKNLRTLISRALDEKVIQDDPFALFAKPGYKQAKKNHLTQEEVDRIEEYALSKNCPEVLRHYAVWFLIGCYTGLRFSDMNQFDKKKHLKGGRLILHTVKTGEIVSIPFVDKLQQLFKTVDYQPLNRTNQKMNENLKILQKACDIEVNLTAHVSRHTFAVRCATAGIPIEVTAKLMAQTDTKSTAIYYKITNPKVDAEFAKLF